MKYQKIAIYSIRIIFGIWSILELIQLEWVNVAVLLAGLILSFVPECYTKCTKIHIPVGASLFLSVFLFGSQFLGSYLGAYTYLSWWDIMLHLVSGIMVGYSGLVLLVTFDKSQILFERKKYFLIAFIIFTTAVTGAVFWEIIEFTGDTFFGTNAQLGSLRDTMEDLICGTIVGGGFAFYIWLDLYYQKYKSCVNSLLSINKYRAK
ncbi:MAG: hypothetical protein U0L26_04935 [Cellulosilyticum sp.]|nr:hypothetical protein [Cellulosilyticum sp.]MEE1071724.1 hypothetical protein [Cellulosilyticum sp.]